jgi:hypothetical protein
MSNHEKAALELAELNRRGVPTPIALANVDALQPLALSTRADADAYIERHGGGAAERKLLGRVVMLLTSSPKYIEALAADLSSRVTLDGADAGLVSEADRLSAALQLNSRALRAVPKPPPPQTPKPPPPPPSEAPKDDGKLSLKATALAPSPFRNGGVLTPTEVERRRQALAALKPRATA